jgi:hypothetical protein
MPITVIRWISVPFAAWFAWGVAVFAGFELEALATYLCPKDQMVSDMCTAPWYGVALTLIFCFGAAMAAGLVVLLCTLIAPGNREQVSRFVYVAGSVVAVVMAVSARAIAPLVCALIVGAFVWRWFDRRSLWPLRF